MSHDIRAPFKRAAVDRRSKCIVNDKWNSMPVRCFGEFLKVKHNKRRIRDGFTEHCFGILLNAASSSSSVQSGSTKVASTPIFRMVCA